MLGLIGRRLLALIPVFLIASFGVFCLLSLVPGDPAVELAGGLNATPERIAQIREQLGLDDPFIVQYGHWLGNAAQGDLGKSFDGTEVSTELEKRLPVSFSLALTALVFGLIIG